MLQRVLQESRLVDVPISVENKPGGGGAVALATLAQRTGGATLMINAPTMLSNQITGRSALLNTDFTALAIAVHRVRMRGGARGFAAQIR